jgi:hypothetical protein
MRIQHSIHPRVQSHSDKVNTCSRRSAANGGQGGKPLRRASATLALRTKAWESTRQQKDIKNPLAYRKPGSMKP